jgi:hypothetical protein
MAVQAYYSAPLGELNTTHADDILGALTRHHHHSLELTQKRAWLEQIDILRTLLPKLADAHLLLEFSIPRMGKRADAVLLYGGIVFVIEFKIGATQFDRNAIDQVEDYALDLKNFHEGSHSVPVSPILVATAVTVVPEQSIEWAPDRTARPLRVNAAGLRDLIYNISVTTDAPRLDTEHWMNTGYKPTPTIIEAARALYEHHSVNEIARSDAGAKNLEATSHCISSIIDVSKLEKRRSICFITGVPGSGKTLAGLNIATRRSESHRDEHAVFLSGNGPLVAVLHEALARDQAKREGISKRFAEQKVRSFVQNIHHFRDEYLINQNAPNEKVVVFDEAQRAWTREQAAKFMKAKRGRADFDKSEPEFLISVMSRHQDWYGVICLIGGGQEINTGEAGMAEWITALSSLEQDWDVYVSERIIEPEFSGDADAEAFLKLRHVTHQNDLHLSVSMRSFRAEKLSHFVRCLLDNDSTEARNNLAQIYERYPIRITRNLDNARQWIRSCARGSERYGIVASSGALRLKPEGLFVRSKIDPKLWFLNDRSDVRSSFQMEDVATEFDIQGLELDWSCVCWDADLRYKAGQWTSHSFKGTKWQSVQSKLRQTYLRNAYRVLLTRARQGMIIVVPTGHGDDGTRAPSYYNGTFDYLISCGIREL